MTTKFSRVPRIQPTPAVCRRPPLPEPPGAPIETLQAWFQYDGNDWYGNPAPFTGTATLTKVDDPETLRYYGRTNTAPAYVALDLTKHQTAHLWTLSFVYATAAGPYITDAIVLPGKDQPPATGAPITTWPTLPPGAYAQARLYL